MSKHQKTYCINGHEMIGENLYTHTRPDGRVERHCKICAIQRERMRRLHRKTPAAVPAKAKEAFKFYEQEANRGCSVAAQAAGYPVRCLECPLLECIYVR